MTDETLILHPDAPPATESTWDRLVREERERKSRTHRGISGAMYRRILREYRVSYVKGPFDGVPWTPKVELHRSRRTRSAKRRKNLN